MSARDEVAAFGRELDEGRNPAIQRGGTLSPMAGGNGRGRPDHPGHGRPPEHPGQGHRRPPENPGQGHARTPPQGRSHATLG